jgi:hypothetical protein
MSNAELLESLMKCLNEFPDGVRDSQLKERFGDDYMHLVNEINTLLQQQKLELLQEGESGEIIYKLKSDEDRGRFSGLTSQHMIVYQTIEKAGTVPTTTFDYPRYLIE